MKDDFTKELLDSFKVVSERLEKLEKYNRILVGAVKEAARIFSSNPPGNLDEYTEEMIWALAGSRNNPKKWEDYLIYKGIQEEEERNK